jgi:hypothetical protein
MANTKISALTSGNPAQAGDVIPIDRTGANFSITAGSIAALNTLPQTAAAVGSKWLNSYTASTGVFTETQPTFTDLSAHPTTLSGYGITDALPIAGGTLTGALLFSADNTYAIGAAGATRPSTVYAGTSVVSPLVSIPSTGVVEWSIGSSPAGISYTGAASLSIGNGTSGDYSGELKLSTLDIGAYAVTTHIQISAANSNITFQDSSGDPKIDLTSTAGLLLSDDLYIGWGADSVHYFPPSTSISNPSAGTVSIDTTSVGNGLGSLTAAKLIENATLTPASATTAGVTGQIAWQGTNGTTGQIFICTSGGTASNAIWMAAALTKV